VGVPGPDPQRGLVFLVGVPGPHLVGVPGPHLVGVPGPDPQRGLVFLVGVPEPHLVGVPGPDPERGFVFVGVFRRRSGPHLARGSGSRFALDLALFGVVVTTRNRGCSIAGIPEGRHPKCELLIRPGYEWGSTVPCGSYWSETQSLRLVATCCRKSPS
jgi:hypothetical protein